MKTKFSFEKTAGRPHIGSGGKYPHSITNPSGSNELCVADVGAHHANLFLADGKPITNKDFLKAAERPIDRYINRVSDFPEACNIWNSGFFALYESKKITKPIYTIIDRTTTIPYSHPGHYAVIVSGPQGGHALHLTVSYEQTGIIYLNKGEPIPKDEYEDLKEKNTHR